MMRRLLASLSIAAAIALSPAAASAADAPAKDDKEAISLAPMSPDKTIDQSIQIGRHTIRYKATIGHIDLHDAKGKTIGQVVYAAYIVPGPATARPVTFAFNGGPGAASVFLNMGAIGPKRIGFGVAGDSPSDPAVLHDNPGTWLDFTDLVFIDPVGTGFSRSLVDADESKKDFYGAKPIGNETNLSPLPWMIDLPSMAAGNYEREGRALNPATMSEVENYVQTDFVTDFLKGTADKAATDRLSARVAAYTGLDPALVRRLDGRVDIATYLREIRRNTGQVGSVYDSNVTAYDPFPASADAHYNDPLLDGIIAPTTSAAVDFITNQVGWKTDAHYETLSYAVNKAWDRDETDAPVTDLRKAIANDPKMQVMIAHGWDDLSCPYFTSKLVIDQMPSFGQTERVKLHVYPGGHMFYARRDSSAAFKRDAMAIYGQ
jgi:carboxypeptidase C (cathepsin A)